MIHIEVGLEIPMVDGVGIDHITMHGAGLDGIVIITHTIMDFMTVYTTVATAIIQV